jgi:UDP-galactopyranose mutase
MTDWFLQAGYITNRADVVKTQIVDVPLGYPVSTMNKSAIVSEIKDYLSSKNVHSIGRFGSWDYANSDECMRQGLELASRLASQID